MFVSAFLTMTEIKRFLFFNVKMQKYPKVIKVNVKSSDERKNVNKANLTTKISFKNKQAENESRMKLSVEKHQVHVSVVKEIKTAAETF